jgi:hypothetical protein
MPWTRYLPSRQTFPKYFFFTEEEFLWLILCLAFDLSEYVSTILTLPVAGDILDLVGLIACFVMFRWVAVISLLELVPGADIFPIFLLTWLIWYVLKKQKHSLPTWLR